MGELFPALPRIEIIELGMFSLIIHDLHGERHSRAGAY